MAVVSGAGAGGGSLGCANTLYRAPRRFYAYPRWAGLADWERALAPHYDEAERIWASPTSWPTIPPISSPGGDDAQGLGRPRQAGRHLLERLSRPDTHIETATYGDAGDSMSLLYTLMVGDGTRVTRPLKLLATIARHPVELLQVLSPRGWSRRTIIVLVMQTLDNAIALRPKRTLGGGVRLRTQQDPERRIRPSSRSPTTSPAGWRSARAASRRAR